MFPGEKIVYFFAEFHEEGGHLVDISLSTTVLLQVHLPMVCHELALVVTIFFALWYFPSTPLVSWSGT